MESRIPGAPDYGLMSGSIGTILTTYQISVHTLLSWSNHPCHCQMILLPEGLSSGASTLVDLKKARTTSISSPIHSVYTDKITLPVTLDPADVQKEH